MSKHTQGKLHVGMRPGPMVYGQNGEQVADCRGLDQSGHNAVRMVACWNACEGIDTDEIEALIRDPGQSVFALHQKVKRIEQQRDELLAATRSARDGLRELQTGQAALPAVQNLLSKAIGLLNRLDGMDCLPIDDEEYASAHEGLSDAIARVQHGKL